MILVFFVALCRTLVKRNEEWQPMITDDFPHLVGIERVNAWMDETLDPCSDFYQYACKGFQERYGSLETGVLQLMAHSNELLMKSILEQESVNTGSQSTNHLFGLAKRYYMSCLDENAIEARGLEPLRLLAFKVLDIRSANLLDDLQASDSMAIEMFFRPQYAKIPGSDMPDLLLRPTSAYDVTIETIDLILKTFQEAGSLANGINLEGIAAGIREMEIEHLKFVNEIKYAITYAVLIPKVLGLKSANYLKLVA